MNKRTVYKFQDLSKNLQQRAVTHFTNDLLQDIANGSIRFNDELNNDDLQSRIDKAMETAERKQTPWFAHEYIMDTCKTEIEGMATCRAEDARYSVSADGKTLRLIETSYKTI